eukprot:5208927-Alexandrium_andersonii.AAC.1
MSPTVRGLPSAAPWRGLRPQPRPAGRWRFTRVQPRGRSALQMGGDRGIQSEGQQRTTRSKPLLK